MKLNAEQEFAVNCREGFWCVLATAGSGKTSVLTERIKALLAEGHPQSGLLALTFTAEAANEMQRRIGITIPKTMPGGFRTFHSLGLRIVLNEHRYLPYGLSPDPFPQGNTISNLLSGAMKENGVGRQEFKEVRAYISNKKRNRIPPEECLNDDINGYAPVYALYERRLREGGMLDFDSMLVESVNILEKNEDVRKRWQFEWVHVDEAGDTDNLQWRFLQLITIKHKNIFIVGDANQCQPPGTLVSVRNGQVPIETLKDGDEVRYWFRKTGETPTTRTQPIQVGCRQYSGNMLHIQCGGKLTRMTPDHWVYATLTTEQPFDYIVYLMWRKDLGFRVGQVKTAAYKNNRRGIGGFTSRCYEENADRAWILHACKTKEDARTWEAIEAAKFGLPTCVFTCQGHHLLKKENLKKIFSEVPESHGSFCLEHHGLSFEHPIFSVEDRPNQRYFKIRAANLIPGLFSLPSTTPFKSEVIENIKSVPYSGPVYSLNVEKHHTYIADGIPVGNCMYGFRGANPNNLTEVEKWFPGAKTIILPVNYRSAPEIVTFCRENAPIDNELTQNMRTTNTNQGHIEFRMYRHSDEEAQSVLSAASENPGNSAILARTNAQLASYETLCTENKIRFHLLGKSGFWHQSEIQAVVRLVNFAMGKKDPEGYQQQQIVPIRGLIFNVSAECAVQLVIERANLEQLYRSDDFADVENFALANLKKITEIAKRFNTIGEFANHARKASHASKKHKDAITIGTIHSMKGLEAKNVFVIGVEEGVLPHKRGDLEEERRIWFVAISRAAERLRISFTGTPSPFIKKYLTAEVEKELNKYATQVETLQRQMSLLPI